MKDVLGLATFLIGALCFVVFITTFKPDAISAVPATLMDHCGGQEGQPGLYARGQS